jgi:hypothetical protein
MKVRSCFGEDGQLQVFDVWENQEAFDEFRTLSVPNTHPGSSRDEPVLVNEAAEESVRRRHTRSGTSTGTAASAKFWGARWFRARCGR